MQLQINPSYMNFRPMLRTEKNDSVLWINLYLSSLMMTMCAFVGYLIYLFIMDLVTIFNYSCYLVCYLVMLSWCLVTSDDIHSLVISHFYSRLMNFQWLNVFWSVKSWPTIQFSFLLCGLLKAKCCSSEIMWTHVFKSWAFTPTYWCNSQIFDGNSIHLDGLTVLV